MLPKPTITFDSHQIIIIISSDVKRSSNEGVLYVGKVPRAADLTPRWGRPSSTCTFRKWTRQPKMLFSQDDFLGSVTSSVFPVVVSAASRDTNLPNVSWKEVPPLPQPCSSGGQRKVSGGRCFRRYIHRTVNSGIESYSQHMTCLQTHGNTQASWPPYGTLTVQLITSIFIFKA